MTPPRVLGIFAKWPAPGAVKTRLGGSPEWGAAVARAFLLDTIWRAVDGEVAAAHTILAYAPSSSGGEFAALTTPGAIELVPQGEGDLGVRLKRFIESQLTAGVERVVVVGTDSPTLPSEFVRTAFEALAIADVVLGPATDGGYYLVGCARQMPPIFDGVDWSSERVLAQTIERLGDPRWRLVLLPPWYDVDTPADWAMLRGHVAAMRRAGQDPRAPRTEAMLGS